MLRGVRGGYLEVYGLTEIVLCVTEFFRSWIQMLSAKHGAPQGPRDGTGDSTGHQSDGGLSSSTIPKRLTAYKLTCLDFHSAARNTPPPSSNRESEYSIEKRKGIIEEIGKENFGKNNNFEIRKRGNTGNNGRGGGNTTIRNIGGK